MSQPAAKPLRLAALCLALLAAALVLALQCRPGRGLSVLPLRDYVEYWAAGQLLVEGSNPYDPELVHDKEREAGRTDEGILMWNPPWSLPLVLPLGLVSVRAGHLLWLLFNFLLVLVCADTLWRLYGGPTSWRLVGLLVGGTFVPTYFALIMGQISPVLVAGAVAFLVLVRQGRDLAAGAATVLLSVKPHLAYLFWLALLLWAIQQRRWRILAGGTLAGLALTGVALFFDPDVLGQYWHTLTTRPPAQYRSPTLGMLVRMALGDDSFRWQFLPLIPGLVWLVVYYRRHQRDWDWAERMPSLLLVSMLTTAYGGWAFDLVLLLVPVVAVAARLASQATLGQRLAALVVYSAINALALGLIFVEVEYLAFIWMTPALLLAYVVFSHGRHDGRLGLSVGA